MKERDLPTFIQEHISKVEPLELQSNLAWWNLATTGEPKWAEEMKRTHSAHRRVYASPEDYHFLQNTGPSEDPLLERQRKLLLDQYVENQIPPKTIDAIVDLEITIEGLYTNFRPVVDGQSVSNNDLKKILVESDDSSLRQKAWEASKEIGGQVEKLVLELVRLRNASALQVGFPDFYTMRLQLQELDPKRLFEVLADLEKVTNPIWERYKQGLDEALARRFQVDKEDLQPWHYHDPFFQEAPHDEVDVNALYRGKEIALISQRFYEAVGLPVEDILEKSDLYERERKNQHAFCLTMDRKQDVRILCNLRDNEQWMMTQLHELGHAVYDKYIPQDLPYLLRTYAHTSTTEAIAQLFGRLSRDSEFLRLYCGVEMDRSQNGANLLVFARWVLVMTHFERDLYQKPDADFRELWWKYVERFQGVKKPKDRHQPDWAAKLHLACAPVYYQNYLLGEMTASQLMHYLKALVKQTGEPFTQSKVVGEFLKERLFQLGARYPWEETLHRVTGEALNPSYFAEDLT
jgi:peptidyl-dipeptidase A